MSSFCGRRCGRALCRLLASEFYTSKLLPCHNNWRQFTFTPWLPYTLKGQLIYIIYRWVLVIYFFIWLILAGTTQGSLYYFIYLTNWAHIAYNIYLITAAVSTTTKVIRIHCSTEWEQMSTPHSQDYFGLKAPSGYWNTSGNQLTWYQMLHWVLFTIGNEGAFLILVLYWSLLFRGGTVSGVNANTHLLNGLLSVLDLWVTGLPINLLHVLYLIIFSTIYSTFAGMYYISSGVIIYRPLNYTADAGAAVGLCLSVTFILLPFIHSVLFMMYLCRQSLVRYVHTRRLGGGGGGGNGDGGGSSEEQLVQETESIELVKMKTNEMDSS